MFNKFWTEQHCIIEETQNEFIDPTGLENNLHFDVVWIDVLELPQVHFIPAALKINKFWKGDP